MATTVPEKRLQRTAPANRRDSASKWLVGSSSSSMSGLLSSKLAQRHAAFFTRQTAGRFWLPRGAGAGHRRQFQAGVRCRSPAVAMMASSCGLLGGQGIEVGILIGISRVHLIQTRFCAALALRPWRFPPASRTVVLGVKLGLLRQVANASDPAMPYGFAFNLFVQASHDFQQGGLARAVQCPARQFLPPGRTSSG